ncbi:MAG: hypothetical protein RQ750_09015 [Roseovarius sp.]|nr:hypothetical protein [Roseovarius sp.]
MSVPETRIAHRYGKPGLYDRITSGSTKLGESENVLTLEGLEAVDEFGIGRPEATRILMAQRRRRACARDFFDRLSANLLGGNPPPVGSGLQMGEDAYFKGRNMMKSVGAGDIAPVEMIFRLPA